MAFIKFFEAALVLPCLVAIGCSGEAIDVTGEEGTVSASEDALLSTNRLSMNRLSMNRLSMNGLSAKRLSPDGLTLAATNLVIDEGGRELLRYMVRCALPAGKTLTTTVDSITYEFEGLVGIAPEWLDGSLSQKGQRWMSACLLAHVNGYGIEVPISLRGDHVTLTAGKSERSAYSKQEVSFFGNVFLPVETSDELGDVGQRMYACGGSNLQTTCGGSTSTFNATRTCADSEDCALKFIGACHDVTSAGADVCGSVLTDSFAKCHTAAKDASGKWPKGAAYNEVITVYLNNADWNALYPSCIALQ